MSQQTFKVGDRVVVKSQGGPNHPQGSPLSGVIDKYEGFSFCIVLDDRTYVSKTVWRRPGEIQLEPAPAEPTDAELAATYRAGREAGKELLRRGFTIARTSDSKTVNFNFEPVIYKVEETTVMEPVVKLKRVDI